MNIQQTAKEAATAAGDILSDYFHNGVTMRTKSASVDLVSDADVNAERAIANVIRNHFPEHSILGEEENSDDVNAEHLWIIDPLDGTNNFAHGIPHFAVSIALWKNGTPLIGVILDPVREDLFVAVADQGATLNGQRISVSGHTQLTEAMIATGFFYDRGEIMSRTLRCIERLFRKEIRGIRRMGAASLDLAWVACGRYGGFFELTLSPWDHAAGRLLVTEAGGRFTDCDGVYVGLEKTSVLASNGVLHSQVTALLQSDE